MNVNGVCARLAARLAGGRGRMDGHNHHTTILCRSQTSGARDLPLVSAGWPVVDLSEAS